jgi:hypothetical protein
MSKATTPASTPVLWWAALGGAFLALQLYVLGAWMRSGKFVASDPGADVMPAFAVLMMWLISILFTACALGAAWSLGRSLLRGERFSGLQVLCLGTWTATWQDPTLNLIRPIFVYNSHYFNRGSWSEFVPFWVSPNGSKMPEPLLWQAGCYLIMQPQLVMFTMWVMRLAQRRWPRMGMAGVLLFAFLACGTFNSINELILVRGEVFAYAGVVHRWSLFAGTQYQFPIYEGYVWAIGCTACAALFCFTDGDGRTRIERSIGKLRLSPLKENAVRVLAAGGFINIALFFYIFVCLLVSTHIDSWPPLPSYFVSGICGPGSGYPCPAAGTPIPTLATPADPALLAR